MPGTPTRWEPFAELGELRSRFDRMFEDMFMNAQPHRSS